MPKRVTVQSLEELYATSKTLETFKVGDQIICKGKFFGPPVGKITEKLENAANVKLSEKLAIVGATVTVLMGPVGWTGVVAIGALSATFLNTNSTRAREKVLPEEMYKIYKANFRVVSNKSQSIIFEKKDPGLRETLSKDWDDFWQTIRNKI